MADWVEDAAPHRLMRSSDPSPATGWTKIPRSEHDRIASIPGRYRTGTSPNIVEMDQSAKDAVDTVKDAADVDDVMTEALDLINGVIRAQRIRENNLRDLISQIIGAANGNYSAFRANLRAISAPSQVSASANRSFIRGKVEDIQSGVAE